MEPSGTRIGPFQIQKHIGSGSFANVYLARDSRNGEQVALKVLHPHIAQDAEFVRRFKREARALQSLQHPNIVRVREFGRDGARYFLAMEYLEGNDLRQLLEARKQLALQDALSITAQVAQALQAAHQRGLTHRDIKPSNIKFDRAGHAKVLDFGLAHSVHTGKLTQSGNLLGTPDYMAPEICEGKRSDIRSDIYSLGIVLYHMLSGIAPFHTDTPLVTMRRQVDEMPPPIESLRPDVPAWLQEVLDRMIAKKPAARFRAPGELLEALHRQKVTPRSSSRALVALAIILIAVAVSAIIVMGIMGLPTPESPTLTPVATPIAVVPTSAPTKVPATNPGVPTVTRIPVAATETFTPLPADTETPFAETPTNAPSPKPTSATIHAAPTLRLTGGNNATQGNGAQVRWEFSEELQPDEWFDLKFSPTNVSGMAAPFPAWVKLGSFGWTREKQMNVRRQRDDLPFPITDSGVYLYIQVIRGKDGKWLEDTSPLSNGVFIEISK